MATKIENIEGIGPTYAAKLRDAGIDTAEQLLSHAGKANDREALAVAIDVPYGNLLRWVNHADLMRLDGVGPQYAELLEASGVDSVAELAQRNAANLTKKLAEVNAARKLAGNDPAEKMVTRWITQAATLPKAVFH